MMNDKDLVRYSRHILLSDIDVAGQEAINQASVMIVGLGGLGSPVALYLAASGVGHLTLVDFDVVDESNLQRQISHSQSDIGASKVESAKESVRKINPQIEINLVSQKVADSEWQSLIANVDIVVDCTDNFTTRFALNRACFYVKKPLVSGAAIRFEGQVSVFDFRSDKSPCYQCLYSDHISDELSCAEAGVLAPLVGVIGSLQALEVLKLIAGAGKSLAGRLILFDGKTHQWREMQLHKDSKCPVCSVNK